MRPFDLTTLDWVALAFFATVWFGYGLLMDRLAHGGTLNQRLRAIRRTWMGEMLRRENRMADSALLGHLIHSVSFFASATLLVVAALSGAFGALDTLHAALSELAITGAPISRRALEARLLLLLVIFVYAFFKFTWAIRQYNYCCALIGAAPPASEPIAPERRAALTRQAAEVLSVAVATFNGGLRAYYFALAALGWFVHPLVFIGTVLWIVLVLLRRQFFSHTLRSVQAYEAVLQTDDSSAKVSRE
ncbi:MAG TPA: DUF599 family protein [Methylomirabilota bacterium]|jgi:uncharacterized membrane protein|nr:DUF599 family protein [Methylomirabilota bacterium]